VSEAQPWVKNTNSTQALKGRDKVFNFANHTGGIMKTAVVLMLSVLLLGSCVPEFTYPLPQNQGTKIDKELLGSWYSANVDDQHNICRFDFTPYKKPGWIDINYCELDDTGKDANCANWHTYTTLINKDKFLSIAFDENEPSAKKEPNSFVLVNYRVKDNELIVNYFSLEKTGQFIKRGVLKGWVRDNPWKLERKVTVTSSGEEVAKVIKEKGVDAFLDPNMTFTLTRDKPKIKR
jgi:hypothetical protein